MRVWRDLKKVFGHLELGFTGFYWVLPSFTGFYLVLLGFTGFYWVLLGFTGFYLDLLGFPGFGLLGVVARMQKWKKQEWNGGGGMEELRMDGSEEKVG